MNSGNKEYPCLWAMTSAALAEELPFAMYDLGAVGVETRDATTMSSGGDADCVVIAGFDDPGRRDDAMIALLETFPQVEVVSREVVDDGWSTGWRDFFQPVILSSIQVITPWMEVPYKDRITVVIDPGQAFGTGGHATTHLVLKQLEVLAGEGKLPASVFDVGIGSGILSIAAVKLGARRAQGIDVEVESIAAVVENAARNGVEGAVEARLGDPKSVEGTWPLVLANIQLAVFKEFAPSIEALVEGGGKLIVSGILDDQVEECLGLWPALRALETNHLDGWAAMVLERPL